MLLPLKMIPSDISQPPRIMLNNLKFGSDKPFNFKSHSTSVKIANPVETGLYLVVRKAAVLIIDTISLFSVIRLERKGLLLFVKDHVSLVT
jgi:hypothetical protein